MSRGGRVALSLFVGLVVTVAVYVFAFPSGCADVGGMPSWERCMSLAGLPAFSVTDWGWNNTLDIILPLLIGLGFGLLVWAAVRPRDSV